MNKVVAQSNVVQEQPPLAAEPDKAQLKAERIQDMLSRVPGWMWHSDTPGIHRLRAFRSAAEAEAFAGFVLELAARRKRSVTINLEGKQVFVTLYGNAARGKLGGLTQAVFNLAGELG